MVPPPSNNKIKFFLFFVRSFACEKMDAQIEDERLARAAVQQARWFDAHEIWHRMLKRLEDQPDQNAECIEQRRALERNLERSMIRLWPECPFSEYPIAWATDLPQPSAPSSSWRSYLDNVHVTVAILTCKRYEHFTRTMNSFLGRCMTDPLARQIVRRWILIDDNSDPLERQCMEAAYPMFEHHHKGPDRAGHPQSLNLLRRLLTEKCSPDSKSYSERYVLLLEDDHLFHRAFGSLLIDCIDVLRHARSKPYPLSVEDGAGDKKNTKRKKTKKERVAQVLLNRNYLEVCNASYVACCGGLRRMTAVEKRKKDGRAVPYLLHQYDPNASKSGPRQFDSQPHFALRPSLVVESDFLSVGPFNESPDKHHELEFALRWTEAGLRSCYLDRVVHRHIGRLNAYHKDPTAEPNAYQLNGQNQYGTELPKAGPGPTIDRPLLVTMTTCRRLNLMVPSFCSFLTRLYPSPSKLGATFYVVDDNSSAEDVAAMRKKFPFVELVTKTPERRGHAISMNIILDEVRKLNEIYDTWWIHLEDDWVYPCPLFVPTAQAILDQQRDLVQLVFKTHGDALHGHCRVAMNTEVAEGHAIRWARHPWNRQGAPSVFSSALNESSCGKLQGCPNGCWWPGPSLNPGLWAPWRLPSDLRFDELPEHRDSFEYRFALEVYGECRKIQKEPSAACIGVIDWKVGHLDGTSAYVLNEGQRRSYDQWACGNHRASGYDATCEHCARHRDGAKE